MPDQDTRLARVMDEAAVRDAIARFADAATTGDYDMFRATWAEDGEFIIGQPPTARAPRARMGPRPCSGG